MMGTIHGNTARLVLRLSGILLLILAWDLVARHYSGLVVASPLDTLAAAAKLLSDPSFIVRHFAVSLKRVALALVFGLLVGGSLGLLAGFFDPFRLMIEPLRWMLMTIPGVVIVVVFMLWFGMGNLMVISITACTIAPVVYVNVSQAMSSVDRSLLEMAEIYRFPLAMKLRRIYAMTVAGPFFSAAVIAVGNGIRVVVLAEVLGANNGIGHCLAISRTNLDTPELYALALISMSIVGGIEFFLLKPLKEKYLWRES
ncbi:ABC transporter permease [Desulfoluna spongiiphila]|uniref:NitT/TauT family transport system permease protein n=1 Tax=Desulfoluna spongiiphila TaxID=419481 RepID=A0A1G5HXZ5_9BACT|nr:ABC transporter permease subunit [Desulfoluna spongiiphila]SCY68663.1 NitT/TauT family transport system permease protein [Desulfoluna spongiiphila]